MKKFVSLSLAVMMMVTSVYGADIKEGNLTEEAVNTENDGIDAELLHRGAEFYVTLYSVAVLYNSFEGAKTYYDGKIQKALTYSYSEKELEVIFDEAVEECGRYKKVVSELITGNAGTEMINKYDDYIDACIDDFKAMKIYYCTDNYDDISAEEARRKLNISLENADKAFEKFKNAMSEAEEKAAEIGGNGRIGITANLSEAEIEEKENYYNEIGTVVNESLAFMTDIDEVIENPLKFKSASDKIQKKLSSISTPENCMLEKEIMLICCDLMEQAKENVYKGAFRYSGNNEYYIKFEYSVVVFDTLFNIILDKEYNTKYVADDEISNENGLESQII